eukprot:SAG11_NODE_847_length_6882_cov_3.352204_9_plen_76_part_00
MLLDCARKTVYIFCGTTLAKGVRRDFRTRRGDCTRTEHFALSKCRRAFIFKALVWTRAYSTKRRVDLAETVALET